MQVHEVAYNTDTLIQIGCNGFYFEGGQNINLDLCFLT